MDTILQPSPTRTREDHVISDDIIEGVIEVRMISQDDVIMCYYK